MFSWAVGEERVKMGVLTALRVAAPLQRARCDATESLPIRPVSEADINATLQHLSRQVSAIIRLQLLTGCRPEEVCMIRRCEVDRASEV